MCGLVGAYNPNKIDVNFKNIIKDMADEIIHRGPNSDGYFIDKNLAFGFRRLSMVDLSDSGSQPFYTKDKSKVMVFNGEIYNYKEIKEELLQDGYEFISKTDSEVLLYGFDKWGEKILDKIRGMFAFAVWDMKKEELFIARDFFGIKPMYYTNNTKDGSFLFGSEIKSFLKNPNFIKEFNESMLQLYFEDKKDMTNETFFKGVYKLNPGHFLKVENNKIEIKKYWELEKQSSEKSKEEYIENIKNSLRESINLHKETDVKLGGFLNKSSDLYVSKFSNPEDIFSTKSVDDSSNKEFLEKINCKYHKVEITPEDSFNNLSEIEYLLDEPSPSFSSLELYFLSKEARKHVTAIITGDGAEELFTNNDIKTTEEIDYSSIKINEILKIKLEKKYSKDIKKTIISEEKLLIADKMSSANSLEMRSPFIDRKVVEEIYNLPEEVKGKDLEKVLKTILEDESISEFKNKENPILEWLKEEKYYSIIKAELHLNEMEKYLDTEKIAELLKEEKEVNYSLIWKIYVLILWYKEYFVKR
ncbi:asparagine synthase (glutamine-hydrolyzing) [Peptostreptococcaceae bacterium OttesenSCG-928-C18]|nr:asparagine synthase (glutamine-hydrolyzing) [Peptostreptococcaceae bacterium OttesenSCG-928-C18]